ncbi:unnamed protein product [Lota lota]
MRCGPERLPGPTVASGHPRHPSCSASVSFATTLPASPHPRLPLSLQRNPTRNYTAPSTHTVTVHPRGRCPRSSLRLLHPARKRPPTQGVRVVHVEVKEKGPLSASVLSRERDWCHLQRRTGRPLLLHFLQRWARLSLIKQVMLPRGTGRQSTTRNTPPGLVKGTRCFPSSHRWAFSAPHWRLPTDRKVLKRGEVGLSHRLTVGIADAGEYVCKAEYGAAQKETYQTIKVKALRREFTALFSLSWPPELFSRPQLTLARLFEGLQRQLGPGEQLWGPGRENSAVNSRLRAARTNARRWRLGGRSDVFDCCMKTLG